jgi:oligopeptide/dipeptide ABC transporter ATP-binding protein
MSEVVLEVEALRRHFPLHKGLLGRPGGAIRAVDGVTFELYRGETFALVGESGCGKTTTARMLVGLSRPTGGEIRFKGRSLTALRPAEAKAVRRQIQMVFQDPYASLDPRRRVGASLVEPLAIHGWRDRAGRRARAEELLGLVGLKTSDLRKYPHQFSGGQRQRIVIARALALAPEVLVCDEPVSALDVSTRAQVLNLLGDLQTRLGLTLLVITHDLGIVYHQCDRVAVMYLGKIVELGPVERVFAAAAHPYTRGLLAVAPKPDPTHLLDGTPLEGELPSPADPPPGCRFHPRCALKVARCEVDEPIGEELAPGHVAACHLINPSVSRRKVDP